MEQSILKTVKKSVNVSPDDPAFDLDIIGAINAEFSTLSDIGVGPDDGFTIEDETTEWSEFLDPGTDPKLKIFLAKVKMAVILKTRLLFDPPTQSFLLSAMTAQLLELEVRLSMNREAIAWVNPMPPVPSLDTMGDSE